MSPSALNDNSPLLPAPILGEYVNIVHLELFYHYWEESGETFFVAKEFSPALLRRALGAPFLLYELLGISALHLSIQKPKKCQFYREEANRLQINALRLYNQTIVDINDENVLAVFLFSGVLALHFFFDIFATPANELEGFLDQLVQSIRLLQGVRTIFDGRWEFIKSSDLQPLLDVERQEKPEYTDEVVQQLEKLSLAVGQSPGLRPHEVEVIKKAIKSLSWVYTTWISADENPESPNPRTVTSWAVIVSAELAVLLDERRPEAIVVLAYFAVLLHRCRNWWAVGTSGQFLLGAVELFLGVEWEGLLAWPRSIVYGND